MTLSPNSTPERPESRVPLASPELGAGPGTAAPPGEGPGLFEYAALRDYAAFTLRSLGRHKLLVIACFAGMLALVALALWAMPKTYRVEARILAQRNQVLGVISNPGLLRPVELDAPTQAARETVLRWDNIVYLVDQTGLVDQYLRDLSPLGKARRWLMRTLTGREQSREDLIEDLAHTLESRLTVDVYGGIVRIVVYWSNAQTAYQLADAAMQNFIEARFASEMSVLGDAVAVLESHAATAQEEVTATTRRLAELEQSARSSSRASRRAQVASPSPGRDLERMRLVSQLEAKKRAVADLEEARDRRLAEAQLQLEQARSVYSDRHPVVLNLRETIATLSRPSPQIDALKAQVRDMDRELGERLPASAPRPHLATADVPLEAAPDKHAAAPTSGDPRIDAERDKLRMLYDKFWTRWTRPRPRSSTATA